MEVRSGKARSQADRCGRHATRRHSLTTSHWLPPHPQPTSSRRSVLEVCSASDTHWDRSSVPGGYRQRYATTGAPAAR
jgi:hypothetical protein